MGRLIPASIIDAASSVINGIDYSSNNQLSDGNIFIGFLTRQKLLKLEAEGDCTLLQKKKFFLGVRRFYEAAISYILQKFPFSDNLLKHAKFLNFEKRSSCHFFDIEYFIDRYKDVSILSDISDDLYDEFVNYQLLKDEDIPSSVWESALVKPEGDGQPYSRIDVIWGYLSTMKAGDNCSLRFPQLSSIAKLVLTLPHSNAGEERVFSLVRLNKTPYRSCLNLDGTLSSILTVKMQDLEPCFTYEPPEQMIEQSRKVTWEYNKKHQKKK